MKILFIASEGLPYSKTGGLADVVQALPKALVEMGHQVAVLLPRYRGNKITSTLSVERDRFTRRSNSISFHR